MPSKRPSTHYQSLLVILQVHKLDQLGQLPGLLKNIQVITDKPGVAL